MPEDNLLKFTRRHGIHLLRSFPGKSLDRRKALALRRIRNEKQRNNTAADTSRSSKDEAPLPAESTYHHTRENERKEFAEIRARAENTVIGAAFGQREPAGKIDDSRRRPHRLHPAVHTPKDKKGNEYQCSGYSGQCPEKPQCPHHEIHDGGNEKSHSHETADIAIIRYETIGKFAERIDEQQGGTDKSKFPGSKQPTVNQRLLDYAQCHSAYIIEAVCCRRTPKSSGA